MDKLLHNRPRRPSGFFLSRGMTASLSLCLTACMHTITPDADNSTPSPAPLNPAWTSIAPLKCYLDTASFADWLFPDYVVCFSVPLQAQWQLAPLTVRAARVLNYHRLAGETPKPYTEFCSKAGRELCFVSGWQSNNNAGYGHDNPWELGNELRMQYPSD